jgi:hypothetical protein
MAQSCHRERTACVVDTLRDAVDAREFTTGVRAGLVALGVTVALGLLWWRARRGAAPLPIAGLAAAAACAYALRERLGLPDRALLGLALLAAAGVVVDVLRLSIAYVAVGAIPGALVIASVNAPLDAMWVRSLVVVATVIGGLALASFDRRWARHGLGAPVLAMWVLGAYVTLPDTEAALAMFGATVVVAVGAWPLRLACVGASGALPMAGLIAWTVRYSGTGRTSSIVGAVACAGVLVIEPAARALRRSGTGPLDAMVNPSRGRWWTLLVVAPIQLALIFVAGRVAGLSREIERAVVIVAAEAILAIALSLVLSARLDAAEMHREDTGQHVRSM